MNKGKGLRRTNWQLQNSLGDIKHNIRKIINSVITIHHVRWVLGNHLVSYILYSYYAVHLTLIYWCQLQLNKIIKKKENKEKRKGDFPRS